MSWEGLGKSSRAGFAHSSRVQRRGEIRGGGERGEELHTGKDQPENVILCNHSTSSHTNFQLYCHIPLLFFT